MKPSLATRLVALAFLVTLFMTAGTYFTGSYWCGAGITVGLLAAIKIHVPRHTGIELSVMAVTIAPAVALKIYVPDHPAWLGLPLFALGMFGAALATRILGDAQHGRPQTPNAPASSPQV
jgi:hypothetical protein